MCFRPGGIATAAGDRGLVGEDDLHGGAADPAEAAVHEHGLALDRGRGNLARARHSWKKPESELEA